MNALGPAEWLLLMVMSVCGWIVSGWLMRRRRDKNIKEAQRLARAFRDGKWDHMK